MAIDKNDIVREIDRVEKALEKTVDHRLTLKKWCITVWASILVASFSKTVLMDKQTIWIIQIIPVIAFWMIESIYGSVMVRRENHILRLEQFLLTEKYDPIDPSSIYLYSMEKKVSLEEKMNDMITAILKRETVSIIYVVLIFVSILLAKIL